MSISTCATAATPRPRPLSWWITIGNRNALRARVVDHRHQPHRDSVRYGRGPSRTVTHCWWWVVDHRREPQRTSVGNGGGPRPTGTRSGWRVVDHHDQPQHVA